MEKLAVDLPADIPVARTDKLSAFIAIKGGVNASNPSETGKIF
jgi:hypothetical protein